MSTVVSRTELGHLADAARHSGVLDVFLQTIERSGLEPTLARVGPLTVFAPSDEAFAALPDGALQALLDDPVTLNQVLTYHLVPGRIAAAEVTGRRSAPTINGESLPLWRDRGLHVDGATVVTADLPAVNGLIHVVDRVLLPAMM